MNVLTYAQVVQYDPFAKDPAGVGTGWQFEEASEAKFQEAVGYAIGTFRNNPADFEKIQVRGMEQDLSWELAAEKYEEKLIEAKYSW